MKKLKLTINGEVKIFDLPENGEYKCEVEESYVPKAGDCVRVERKEDNSLYWCKLTNVTTAKADFNIAVNSKLEIYENEIFYINSKRIYTKITTEELKAKYAEAGYDWDYDTDTIKPIKWVPKDGDKVWTLNIYMKPYKMTFIGDGDFNKKFLEKGLLFQTEEECRKFADHCWSYLNNKKE